MTIGDGYERAAQDIAAWIEGIDYVSPRHSPDRVLKILADGIRSGDFKSMTTKENLP